MGLFHVLLNIRIPPVLDPRSAASDTEVYKLAKYVSLPRLSAHTTLIHSILKINRKVYCQKKKKILEMTWLTQRISMAIVQEWMRHLEIKYSI